MAAATSPGTSRGEGGGCPTAKKVTPPPADLRAALKRYFLHPDYGIVFEVAKSTGHAAHRHLDAVAMDLWPSRGLELHGIEIKVSKQDLKRELADPAKGA